MGGEKTGPAIRGDDRTRLMPMMELCNLIHNKELSWNATAAS